MKLISVIATLALSCAAVASEGTTATAPAKAAPAAATETATTTETTGTAAPSAHKVDGKKVAQKVMPHAKKATETHKNMPEGHTSDDGHQH